MEEPNQEIVITCGQQEFAVDIEDVDGALLADFFHLQQPPTAVCFMDGDKRKLIPLSNKRKLTPGGRYFLPTKERPGQGPSATSRASAPSDSAHTTMTSPARSQTFARNGAWHRRMLPEIVQNAVVASKVAYADSNDLCCQYLTVTMESHNLHLVVQSQHGKCPFVLASEERDRRRVYLAFRGSQSMADWSDNLKAFQVEASSTAKFVKGKVHSGFLGRAALFPIEKILADDDFKDAELVVCGHSLGGAVATIVAIVLMLEVDRRKKAGADLRCAVTCVTFGAPLVGDRQLREFCASNGIAQCLFHFVSEDDPVPRLLSYAHCLSALSAQIDNQVRALVATFATAEAATFYEGKRRTWIEEKERYVDILSKVTPAFEPLLDLVSFMAGPQYAGALFIAKGFSSVIRDVVLAAKSAGSKTKDTVYSTIGNYMFLSKERSTNYLWEHHEEEKIERCLEMSLERCIGETAQDIPVYHAMENYESAVNHWAGLIGTFPLVTERTVFVNGQQITSLVARTVSIIKKYQPEITAAELVRVQSQQQDILRLRLTGSHLFHYVHDKCSFNLGFPFGSCEDKVVVKKMTLSSSVERLIFEEAFKEPPAISDHGTTLTVTTQFGSCEYLLRKDQMRNLHIQSVDQISHHDCISVLIKRAIQRGMAIAQIRRENNGDATTWKASSEKIIQEVIKLASITLERRPFEELCQLFDDCSKNIAFILSNEVEYRKIQGFCDSMQAYLRKPLKITAEKSVAKKIGIGVATLVGGALLAYLAGPGLIVIGAVEAVPMVASVGAGALGAGVTNVVTSGLLTDRMVDENYEQVLAWVTAQLFRRLNDLDLEEGLRRIKIQAVSDLIEDGSIFNTERALLLMFDHELGVENFKGSDLGSCTEESKLNVIKRIESIRTIHNIRTTLAKQCYIGVVGVQDAGKTTLLNALWGVGGRTGHFEHTDAPMIYEVHKSVLVVDFPGSNSLDYHAKTFAICGAMNNLILLVVPYTGDISELIGKEITKVFSVMAGSDSTHVLLCINKCGYELPGAISQELADKEDPVGFLRQRFAARLNEYYENEGCSFAVNKDNILFTDWKVGDSPDMRRLGIVSAQEVRNQIKAYLLKHHIFEPEQEEELERILSPAALF